MPVQLKELASFSQNPHRMCMSSMHLLGSVPHRIAHHSPLDRLTMVQVISESSSLIAYTA